MDREELKALLAEVVEAQLPQDFRSTYETLRSDVAEIKRIVEYLEDNFMSEIDKRLARGGGSSGKPGGGGSSGLPHAAKPSRR